MKTYSPKPGHIERRWYVVDASDKVLGRLASEVAAVLRGKHKPIFAPHMDTGDHVIVVNAEKVRLTGGKETKKVAYRHSGYPGGIRAVSYDRLLAERPTYVIEKAVKGMLPKNRLGRAMFRKLHVVAGPEHPHAAQQPEAYDLERPPAWEGLPSALRSAAPQKARPSEAPVAEAVVADEPAAAEPAAKRTAARKTTTPKAPATKTAAKKTTARKTTARRTTARKTTAAAKSAATKTTARKSAAKKTSAKKTTARKTTRKDS